MIRSKIQELPKADVHNHLHLGGTAIKLKKRYPNTDLTIPERYNGLPGMIDFIYNDLNTIMLTSADVVFFMEMAIESSIDDNITLLEASVDIGLARFFNNSVEAVIDLVAELKEKYRSQIDFRPDIGVNKDLALDKVYSDGLKCILSGQFNGLDIYGKEVGQRLDSFQKLFDHARENNLKTKVHIGEFSGSETIENAILLLNPNEIQHGIKAAGSKRTMDMILENDIRLNVCPTSNISLGSVENIMEHPIRKLFDHGIKITINTDDLLLFGATLTDQFVELADNNIFSFEEIEHIRKNAFK
jgi:adenosine deaminase